MAERFHHDVVQDFVAEYAAGPHAQPVRPLQREDRVRGGADTRGFLAERLGASPGAVSTPNRSLTGSRGCAGSTALTSGTWLERVTGAPVAAPRDERYGAVLNVQRGTRMRFECHIPELNRHLYGDNERR